MLIRQGMPSVGDSSVTSQENTQRFGSLAEAVVAQDARMIGLTR